MVKGGLAPFLRVKSGPDKKVRPVLALKRRPHPLEGGIKEGTVENQGFATAFTVDQTPEEALAAIQNVRGWWSEEIEGGTGKPGDEFTYRYKNVHHCKMKLTEVVPGKKVVWRVLDNYFNFTKDESEWKGTESLFKVTQKGGKTEARFTHRGLVSK